ncbi:SET and MYND domain-containing protein 4 [Mortierella claussenii]|nr:SET and MYND domain-containing protein 4 [Mortierella claussenii]
MATGAASHAHASPHGQGQGQGQGQDLAHAHSQLAAALSNNTRQKLDACLDEPVLACYDRALALSFLSNTSGVIDMAIIQEAFVNPPQTIPSQQKEQEEDESEAAILAAAGLVSVPDIQGRSNSSSSNETTTSTTDESTHVQHNVPSTRLDPRFKIGFSKLYGHAVGLSSGSITSGGGGGGDSRTSKIESGTYVFEQDEMPYASVVERVWRGKLCEECLKNLPKTPKEIVICPVCPNKQNDTISEQGKTKEINGAKCNTKGPAKFCSQGCLRAAWTSWHGYECKAGDKLLGLSQLTRLALRVYWQNTRWHLSISSNVFTLAGGVSGISLGSTIKSHVNNNAPRVTSLDGSDISSVQLCHHFNQLDPITKTSFLMTGYYLERLFHLRENSAVELAHIQALIKFNSFAIKAQVQESTEVCTNLSSTTTAPTSAASEATTTAASAAAAAAAAAAPSSAEGNLTRLADYAIGSGLYLLASMFNHSCAPNAMVVFGANGKSLLQDPTLQANSTGSDPRRLNVVTNKSLKADPDLPVLIEISYGPQGGRMATEERKECLRRSHLFECNCSACNDRYAEAVRKKIFKCPKNGYACRPMTETDPRCPTCGTEIDMTTRYKVLQLIARLLAESQDPSIPPPKRLMLLRTLEAAQSKVFVDTCVLYGNTCDQLAMLFAQAGDLTQSIEWCKKALKVVVVHFAHDSIEVAQETLKLAGLLFNNMQVKEALKQVQIAITLYRGHYGVNSRHPDLLELYEMEKVLRPLV